ncbi:MAG: nitroreductase family protein [Coriobacteriales bacterium]|jgi:nitroreductase|nr:nitroreductase family protein [Coriobacteriales bacterium]
MPVLDIIARRKSIRHYQIGAEISDEQIHDLLEAAMLAPSACGMRPWEFIVTRSREKLDAIRSIHPHTRMLASASAAIIVVANFDIHNAISGDYIPQDCAAATENILLQAVAEGLGACWCGVYPKEDFVAELSRIFDIKGNRAPFNVIALGVPDEAEGARGFYEEEKASWE